MHEMLLGKKFQDWTIISLGEKDKDSKNLYKVRCTCGYTKQDYLYRIKKTGRCRKCSRTRNSFPYQIGDKIGNWSFVSLVPKNKHGQTLIKAQCLCGNLRNGISSYFKKHPGCCDCAKKRFRYCKVGETFGSWTVVSESSPMPRGHKRFLCRCSCGYESVRYSTHLIKGKTLSCRKCHIKNHLFIHGSDKNPEYCVWSSMKARCNNSSKHNFYLYGGRGIKVCERWNKFENFLADMGQRPKGYQIDRIDPDGNYCKENCRWVLPEENIRNRRFSKKYRGQYIYVRRDKLCKKCAANVLNLKIS